MVEDSSASFSFGRDEAFGIVEMVDTATVVVSVDDPAALARIQVNRLVAILGTRLGELYIGMVSKIVRKAIWMISGLLEMGLALLATPLKCCLLGPFGKKTEPKRMCSSEASHLSLRLVPKFSLSKKIAYRFSWGRYPVTLAMVSSA